MIIRRSVSSSSEDEETAVRDLRSGLLSGGPLEYALGASEGQRVYRVSFKDG